MSFSSSVSAASLTEHEVEEFTEVVLDMLERQQPETHAVPFNRTKIDVLLSGSNPIVVETLFRPGSGVDNDKARAIADNILAGSTVPASDAPGATQYTVSHVSVDLPPPPPPLLQTMSPAPAPSSSPSEPSQDIMGDGKGPVDVTASDGALMLNLIIAVLVLVIVFLGVVVRRRRNRAPKLSVLPTVGIGDAPIVLNGRLTAAQQIARAQLQQARLEGAVTASAMSVSVSVRAPQPRTQQNETYAVLERNKAAPPPETYAALGPQARQPGAVGAPRVPLSPRPAADNQYTDPRPEPEMYETINETDSGSDMYAELCPRPDMYAELSPRSPATTIAEAFGTIAEADDVYMDPSYMAGATDDDAPVYMTAATDDNVSEYMDCAPPTPDPADADVYLALPMGAQPEYENPARAVKLGADRGAYVEVNLPFLNRGNKNTAYDNAEATDADVSIDQPSEAALSPRPRTLWDDSSMENPPDTTLPLAKACGTTSTKRRGMGGSIQRFGRLLSRKGGQDLATPTSVGAPLRARPVLDDALAASPGSTLQRDRTGRMRPTPVYYEAPAFQDLYPLATPTNVLERADEYMHTEPQGLYPLDGLSSPEYEEPDAPSPTSPGYSAIDAVAGDAAAKPEAKPENHCIIYTPDGEAPASPAVITAVYAAPSRAR